MIASLQMYDWPELVAAHSELWTLIRAELCQEYLAVPMELTRCRDESDAWLREDLLLSQTCGMPYRLNLHNKVTLVGTPDYGVTGCPPGYYRSVFVARKNDPRSELVDFADGRFAYNNRYSQSGYAAAYFHVAPLNFWFSREQESGGHKESAAMVAAGSADIAALDAISWRHVQAYDLSADQLRVVAWTAPTPGLPYIASKQVDRQDLFEAIDLAVKALSTEAKDKLGLKGLEYIPSSVYLALPSI
jgi:ABC-type phosphate/phosphonate transport system substrate-binding protein